MPPRPSLSPHCIAVLGAASGVGACPGRTPPRRLALCASTQGGLRCLPPPPPPFTESFRSFTICIWVRVDTGSEGEGVRAGAGSDGEDFRSRPALVVIFPAGQLLAVQVWGGGRVFLLGWGRKEEYRKNRFGE